MRAWAGTGRWRPVAWWRRPAVALSIAAMVGCSPASPGERVRQLTLATGGTGGVYYPLGGALAQIYTQALPGVNASAQATVASVFNMQAVDQGKVDVAFTQGDVAYLAWTTGTPGRPHPHTNLRGLAVLYVNTLQLVTGTDTGIRRVADLRRRRVGVGAPGSGTEAAARIVIEAHGLAYRDVRADYLSFSEVAAQLQDRTLDAGFVVASFPVAALTDAATTVGVRLLPIEPEAADRIIAGHPFFKQVVIPAGTYRGQDEDLPTLGVDNLLVCRADLPDDLVHAMTRVLFESVPELIRTHAAARGIRLDNASATPVPLHPGAARYYAERGATP